MGDVGAYANHFRLESLNVDNVLDDVVYCLKWTADHESGACLVADGFEGVKTLQTVAQ